MEYHRMKVNKGIGHFPSATTLQWFARACSALTLSPS